jgi:hypothetical protein
MKKEVVTKYYIGTEAKIWGIPGVLYDSLEEALESLNEWVSEDVAGSKVIKIFRVTVEKVAEKV